MVHDRPRRIAATSLLLMDYVQPLNSTFSGARTTDFAGFSNRCERTMRDVPASHAASGLELTDAELVECAHAATLAYVCSPRWSLTRWRTRRAQLQVHRTLSERLRTHVGPVPGQCDHCGERAPVTHVIHPPDNAPRFAHYCSTCAPSMPPGWCGLAGLRP